MSIEEGDRAMSQGSRWPKLKLGAGDRTRMHFLTSGKDNHIAASQVHLFGSGQQTRRIVCVRALTEGEESCQYCEEGHTELRNRFMVWAYVHSILHMGDNPDEEGDSWEAKEVEIIVAGGEKKKRNMFQEIVDKPLLIDMPAGRQRAWWKQFVSAFTNHGNDLQSHLYELHRVGAGRDDTDYTLTALRKMVIKPEHAEHQNELPNVKEIFREGLRFGPSTSLSAGQMGTDQLEEGGGGQEQSSNGAGELEPAPEAAPSEEEASQADELL